jgi:hypothetical protein
MSEMYELWLPGTCSSTILEACGNVATIENRPLLILIFTYGIGDTSALQMGANTPKHAPS